jgi:signal transduction histidine kinase
MAETPRASLRLGVVLALAVVALFEVLSLLLGVRSARRLQARVTHDVQQQVEAVRPRLEAALARGGPAAWNETAGLALQLRVATEVEVLDGQGQVILSRPSPPPVVHELRGDQRERVVRGHLLSVVAEAGPTLRALSYVGFTGGGRTLILRLATPVSDLEDELREQRQVLLGHGAALSALMLAAVLTLLPRRGERSPTPPGALHAYEEAMELLRDRGEEMSARHEAERRRMEDAIHEKEALARAGELTAGIVHEVRNGLGTIVGYARLLERDEPGGDPAEAARSIRAECETLEVVVRRFNDFIRRERLNVSELDLARLLSRVVDRELRGREVSRGLSGLDEPLWVRGDEELLERAFENLVRNAADAAGGAGARGRVHVRAATDGEEVELRIDDDGPGLPPNHPGEVRPFFTTKAGGLGLGLPIARKIVLLHGGALELKDRAPRGVSARVVLPVGGPES